MAFELHFAPILAESDRFLAGAALTTQLSIASTVAGMLIGGALAVARVFGPAVLRWPVAAYVEVVRNTPLLVQLYLVYFVLPKWGLRLDSVAAATLALSLNLAAYAAEIIRAGLQSVDRGQIEAGLSLGLPRGRVLRHVVLVPALCAIYPALGSQFVLQILGSALASAIAAEELTAVSNNIAMESFRNFEVFIVAGVIYLVLVLLFRALFTASGRMLFRWTT